MNRKIIKVISILQIILSLVAYFSMSIHFDADKKVFAMLANTDFIGTVLRLALYVVPGIHLLSGLYGLVFSDKKILLIIEIIELISCGLTFTFVGSSNYMFILSAITTLLSIIYLVNVIIIKNDN